MNAKALCFSGHMIIRPCIIVVYKNSNIFYLIVLTCLIYINKNVSQSVSLSETRTLIHDPKGLQIEG